MLLIRHTTIAAPPGICYGRSEISVAETFAEEVEALVTALRQRLIRGCPGTKEDGIASPAIIWTSPMTRCRVLAETLRRHWREFAVSLSEPGVCIDERLAELNFGEWEGINWDALRGSKIDAWMRDPWRERPPGGETAAEMWARVGAFRAERDGIGRGDDLVITHAGVIRAWRSIAEQRDWQELFAEKIPFCSVWTAE